MSPAKPEVTVVIPTRDRYDLLRVTLASVLAQEGVVLEVVVVDDGSRDGTAEFGRESRDPRVRTVRHETSRGVARARNAGIASAAGAWLAFLDDDDLWAPDKLARQLSAARAADAGFAYSAAMTFESDGRVLHRLDPPPGDDVLARLMPGNMIPAGASNVIARTDLVRRLGGFDESLDHFADWDLWIRLARESRAAVCDEVHVAYRLHAGSMLVTNWRPVADEFDRVVRKNDPDGGDPGLARVRAAGLAAWQAWGHRRSGRRARAAWLYAASGVRHRSRGNLARAVGCLLGERVMQTAGRIRGGERRWRPHPAPGWLTSRVSGGGTAPSAPGATSSGRSR